MDRKKYISDHLNEMITDICQFAAIPSVLDPETVQEDAPFGIEVKNALEWILKKGESFGFETKNYDGYCGEINVGHGEKILGIMCHADVVSAGEGWDTEPFVPTVKNGKIYGRGTADDKGPIVSSLYSVKYLSENGLIPDDITIRLIIGCDEEEDWRCIEYYKENCERLPDYAIVPDGYFPMIFCEKGLLDYDMVFLHPQNQKADIQVRTLKGGTARNVVPAKAECVLAMDKAIICNVEAQLKAMENIQVLKEENTLIVNSFGKSVHGMWPENGENAISRLMEALGNIKESTSIDQFVTLYNENIGLDYNGRKMNICFEDDLSGISTFNVGMLEMNNDGIVIKVNYRYPASMERCDAEGAVIKSTQDAGFQYRFGAYINPVYIDPESKFMKVLMKSYVDATGDSETKPFAIGGATYARGIPNAVSYGPLFPYETELAHEANEFLLIDSLEKMTFVYIHTLEALIHEMF